MQLNRQLIEVTSSNIIGSETESNPYVLKAKINSARNLLKEISQQVKEGNTSEVQYLGIAIRNYNEALSEILTNPNLHPSHFSYYKEEAEREILLVIYLASKLSSNLYKDLIADFINLRYAHFPNLFKTSLKHDEAALGNSKTATTELDAHFIFTVLQSIEAANNFTVLQSVEAVNNSTVLQSVEAVNNQDVDKYISLLEILKSRCAGMTEYDDNIQSLLEVAVSAFARIVPNVIRKDVRSTFVPATTVNDLFEGATLARERINSLLPRLRSILADWPGQLLDANSVIKHLEDVKFYFFTLVKACDPSQISSLRTYELRVSILLEPENRIIGENFLGSYLHKHAMEVLLMHFRRADTTQLLSSPPSVSSNFVYYPNTLKHTGLQLKSSYWQEAGLEVANDAVIAERKVSQTISKLDIYLRNSPLNPYEVQYLEDAGKFLSEARARLEALEVERQSGDIWCSELECIKDAKESFAKLGELIGFLSALNEYKSQEGAEKAESAQLMRDCLDFYWGEKLLRILAEDYSLAEEPETKDEVCNKMFQGLFNLFTEIGAESFLQEAAKTEFVFKEMLVSLLKLQAERARVAAQAVNPETEDTADYNKKLEAKTAARNEFLRTLAFVKKQNLEGYLSTQLEQDARTKELIAQIGLDEEIFDVTTRLDSLVRENTDKKEEIRTLVSREMIPLFCRLLFSGYTRELKQLIDLKVIESHLNSFLNSKSLDGNLEQINNLLEAINIISGLALINQIVWDESANKQALLLDLLWIKNPIVTALLNSSFRVDRSYADGQRTDDEVALKFILVNIDRKKVRPLTTLPWSKGVIEA